MYFQQVFLGCLAHASYIFGSEGEAAVVDPQRDIDLYLDIAAQQGLRIRHIFETHLHADFVSGHVELAKRTGAIIYMGAKANASFPHTRVSDGYQLQFGRCQIRVLETPGHTPEGISLVLTDLDRSAEPWAVLTGDTLFIGDVGRPDLSPTHTPEQLAGMLYDSLHNKLLPLADSVMVYPAHGAGSLCGRNMRAESFSTMGTERLTNYALQIPSREAFIRELTTNLAVKPQYFQQDAEINRQGAVALDALPPLAALRPAEVKERRAQGAIVLDTRSPEAFAAGHVPGSVNIALSGQFASWAGALLGLSCRPILVAESAEKLTEARMRLARVGMDNVAGCLEDGIEGWRRSGLPVAQLPQVSVRELRHGIESQALQVLDVRRDREWNAGHIEGAQWYPLDQFAEALPHLDKMKTVAVHCKSGYRSAIACSLLLSAGYTNIVNVTGGFDAWQKEYQPASVA
jgi:glyoxylase-like metal-dependent hydrolase (beta-lactamase superfamily II)/rhodanese-related sulfurtransferase